MGFIKAALNAVSGTFADQYGEVFYCESLSDDVLLRKGQRQNGAGSTNKATENIISDGSKVIVNEGQCLVVVDNGKVVDFCAEAGMYIYQTGTTPSLLTGGFKSLAGSFKTAWDRTVAGGQAAADQRVYYVNMKEIKEKKYGLGNVVYRDKEFNTTITIMCYGLYSYKIQNPFIFYKEIASNVSHEFRADELDETLKSEIQDALQPALRKIALKGYSYDELPLYTTEIGTELNNILTEKWLEKRGIAISSFTISSVQPDEASRLILQKIQISRAYGNDAAAGAGRMLDAQASAFEKAASNSGGALQGILGLGSMQNLTGGGGNTVADLYGMAQQQKTSQQVMPVAPQSPTEAPTQSGWACGCGKAGNEGKFCDECGTKKPEVVNGWKCSCEAISKGKFCHECGSKKPVDEPLYICDKCGWEPTDPKNPPKFCPECGDVFDDKDVKNK